MPSTLPVNLNTDYAVENPRASSSKVDTDHAALEAWSTLLLAALANVIRSDDTLVDQVVRYRNLHPEILAALNAPASPPLLVANNLSDVPDKAAARTNLGVAGAILAANNLSDIPDKNAARVNLGLNGAMLAINNLVELSNVATAQTNLGAGAVNGLAQLDGDKRLLATQLPSSSRNVGMVEDYAGGSSIASPYFPPVTSGGASAYQVDGIAGHPGILRLATGTTSGTGFAATKTAVTPFMLGNGQLTWESVLGLEVLGALGLDYNLFCGFVDANAVPVNGLYFKYNYAVNGGALQAVAISASVATAVNLAFTPGAGGWVRLGIVVNSLGTSVDFYVNGTKVATITTNLPLTSTVLGAGVQIGKLTGTTNQTMLVDYQVASNNLNNPR